MRNPITTHVIIVQNLVICERLKFQFNSIFTFIVIEYNIIFFVVNKYNHINSFQILLNELKY